MGGARRLISGAHRLGAATGADADIRGVAFTDDWGCVLVSPAAGAARRSNIYAVGLPYVQKTAGRSPETAGRARVALMSKARLNLRFGRRPFARMARCRLLSY